ncbi:MAG: hypothetical protein WBG86_22285 [Polyangiales bacterium]
MASGGFANVRTTYLVKKRFSRWTVSPGDVEGRVTYGERDEYSEVQTAVVGPDG